MIKKAALIAAVLTCAFGQTARDGYRNAYRAWREADPNLERDAAASSASIAPRADRAAALAAKYGVERKAYLEHFADEYERKLKLLETPTAPAPEDWDRSAAVYLAEESKMVQRTTDTFTGDPDAGLRRLRGMLLSEDQALNAVNSAAVQDRKAADAASAATAAADQARLKALKLYRDLNASLHQNTQQSTSDSAAWADYYRTLADSVRPAAAPVERIPPASPSALAIRQPAPDAITPVPLIRYTGAWTFPANGLYHGLQPELVDMLVHEEGGLAEGTLFARFKLPPEAKTIQRCASISRASSATRAPRCSRSKITMAQRGRSN